MSHRKIIGHAEAIGLRCRVFTDDPEIGGRIKSGR